MRADSLPHFDLIETWQWFVPLGLIAWILLLATIPRTRAAWSVTALAVFTHVVTYAPRFHMHDLDGYTRILEVGGLFQPDLLFGEGEHALLTWPLALMRWPVDGMHWVQSALSLLAVPHLYGLMRRLFDERTAIASACLLAIAPLPLALATTDTPYVPLMTMEVLAIHGLVRKDWVGDLMVVIGAGMVTHLRPVEGLFGAGVCALAWWLGRRRASAGVAFLVLWRLHNWVIQPPTTSGMQAQLYLKIWREILRDLWGVGGRIVALDPTLTPVALTALALIGVVVGWRRARGATAGFLFLVVASSLIYVNQPIEADRLRFHLPAQPWLCALAGIGVAPLLQSRIASAVAAVALAVSTWTARQPYPPYPWQVEYRVLRQALETLPPGTVVAYDASVDKQQHQQVWARLFSGAQLVPLEQAPPDTVWRWVGLADHIHGVKPPLPAPVIEVTIEPPPEPHDLVNERMWGCDPCEWKPLTIGLYRMDGKPTP